MYIISKVILLIHATQNGYFPISVFYFTGNPTISMYCFSHMNAPLVSYLEFGFYAVCWLLVQVAPIKIVYVFLTLL